MIDLATLRDQYQEYNRGDIEPAEAFGLALTTSIPAYDLLTAFATALEDLDLPGVRDAVLAARDLNEWSTET